MAKGGKVEIEVELTGVQESEKELAGLADNGAAVGETFTSMGDAVSTFGGEANEALGAVGGAAGDAVGAFVELGGAVKEGGLSFSALAGPIGVVIAGVYALTQAWREYKDEIDGVTQAGEAYLASLSELTSAVEELAAAGVNLNEQDIEMLHNLSMKAKLGIEQAQIDKERAVEDVKKIKRLNVLIASEKKRHAANVRDAKDEAYQSYQRAGFANLALENLKKIEKAQGEVNRLEEKNLELVHETSKQLAVAARNFKIFEETKEEMLERGVDALKKRAQQELSLEREIETSKITIQEDSLKKQKALEVINYKKRIDALADQELKDKGLQARAVESAFQVLQHNIRKLEEADQAKRRERYKKQVQSKFKKIRYATPLSSRQLVKRSWNSTGSSN
jgi:hypothetical protein